VALRRRSRNLDEIGADMKQKGVFGFCVPRRFFPLPLSPAFSRFQKPPNVKKKHWFYKHLRFFPLPLSPAFSRFLPDLGGPEWPDLLQILDFVLLFIGFALWFQLMCPSSSRGGVLLCMCSAWHVRGPDRCCLIRFLSCDVCFSCSCALLDLWRVFIPFLELCCIKFKHSSLFPLWELTCHANAFSALSRSGLVSCSAW